MERCELYELGNFCERYKGGANNVNDNIYINCRPCAAYDGSNKRGNCAAGVALRTR